MPEKQPFQPDYGVLTPFFWKWYARYAAALGSGAVAGGLAYWVDAEDKGPWWLFAALIGAYALYAAVLAWELSLTLLGLFLLLLLIDRNPSWTGADWLQLGTVVFAGYWLLSLSSKLENLRREVAFLRGLVASQRQDFDN